MENENNNSKRVIILWTSGDKEVALNMVLMYTLNAKKKGWWKEVTLIIWGPSSNLSTKDKEIQEYIAQLKEAGVKIEACKRCADIYGVSNKLEDLGIEVKLMGMPLTSYLKEGFKVMTF
jgi:hypothetical protein